LNCAARRARSWVTGRLCSKIEEVEMPYPKPTPTNLRVIRGNPGGKALPKNEPQPQIPDLVPNPPRQLKGLAAEEWRRVVTELYRLKLVTVVDINPLAAYCQAYKTWCEAVELMNELDATFMKGYVLKSKYGVVKNPLHGVARDAAREMVRYASEFGLTPAARTRLSTPSGEARQPDKFDGLIPS
jgi:P27 family predicted phage terminase small subunit